jgi:hypothetical protein
MQSTGESAMNEWLETSGGDGQLRDEVGDRHRRVG